MDNAGGHYVDAIKTLHQTVVSLRGALEESRNEILELRDKSWPLENLESAVATLSIENHLLRQQIVEAPKEETRTQHATEFNKTITYKNKKIAVNINLDITHNRRDMDETVANKEEEEDDAQNGEEKHTSNAVLQHSPSTDLIDQEVDNIELIFTNEDTKETSLKEPLISIEGGSGGNAGQADGLFVPSAMRKHSDFDQNLSADISDRELEDDVFNDNFENENQENTNFQSQTFDFTRENSQIYNSKSDNSINHEEMKSLKSFYSSFQDSSFENKSMEKDESFDRFDERIRYLETDMSKVGIHDVEYGNMGRRNTCPNPLQYRPMSHREALRGMNPSRPKCRPLLAFSNAVRKESGAQTEISALPANSSWRSESSLALKVKMGENFMTLPSKFPMPGSRLRPNDKTVEARRILLSDIGFTSMVPELSRSADHLCPTNLKTCPLQYGQFLKTTDLYSPGYSQNEVWSSTSPSCRHSQSRYSSLLPLSPPAPGQSRRCSAPVSPSRKTLIRTTTSRVRFANGSLPELRSDWGATNDSGDSTDSLVDEAEQYLRRSIDCITSGKDASYYSTPKTGMRRASAPEPGRDNVPPSGWQPFLPRLPRDLRLDYWVKVISPEGRVRGGRVRYVGHLLSQSEQFVGVQLCTPDGHSDGTYNNRRYFQCEPNHGIFVPFRKVIMVRSP